jgi:hypothetical protein
MLDALNRVLAFIRARWPLAFCPPCIASDLGMTEQDVRQRLQVIVARPDLQQQFSVARRLCDACREMGDCVALR